jgi:4,5-dihydroxyphthalate decarboxylase
VTSLRVSFAVGDSDLNRALLDGTVTIPGIDLVVRSYPSPERHWRMLRNGEFDVAEVSIGAFLAVNEREPGRFVAVPAFPHRRFRHSYIYVGSGSGLTSPRELAGGRIGLRTWTNTAGLWARGILQDEYGLDLRGVRWVLQDEDTAGAAGRGRFATERAGPGESVVALTAAGKLDALIYPETPDVLGAPDGVRRLFADAKSEEQAYFRRTGCFPIMHTVALRRGLVDQLPWLPYDVLTAFRRAKDVAVAALADPRKVALAWARHEYEAQRELMGPDPWAYGAEASRRSLETVFRYAAQQGIVERPPAVDDVFPARTFAEPPRYVRS